MALIVAQQYPQLFAAVGVHSGVPPGVATDLFSALRTMFEGPVGESGKRSNARRRRSHIVPTIVFHGDADRTVHPANGEAIHRWSHQRQHRQPGATVPSPRRSTETRTRKRPGAHAVTRTRSSTNGISDAELWVVHGGGHAWAGGNPEGTYTDSGGPDASREMVRFFLQQRRSATTTPLAPEKAAIVGAVLRALAA